MSRSVASDRSFPVREVKACAVAGYISTGIFKQRRDWVVKRRLRLPIRVIGVDIQVARKEVQQLRIREGYATREERSEKLLELVEKKARGESLNAHEAQVVANYEEKSKTNHALKNAIQTRVDRDVKVESASYPTWQESVSAANAKSLENIFSPKENCVVDSSGVFPLLTDADAQLFYGSRFNKYVLTHMTDGRREGGGYFLPRMIFQ